jgi:Mg2+-importing ATPase
MKTKNSRRDRTDALIILVIVLIIGLLAFWQERGTTNAVKKLLAIVQIGVTVRCNNETAEVSLEEIVPGDITGLILGD